MSLKDEIFEILKESKASDKAKSMGLVHKGGGAYGMDKDAPTIAVSTDGGARLQKVDSDEEAKALKKGGGESPDEKPLEKAPVKGDINSEAVTKAANEINAKKQPELTPEQLEKETDKKKFLNVMVDAILTEPELTSGAGKYEMSRDDLVAYKSYLDGDKPKVPSFKVSDKDLDQTLGIIKERLGKDYGNFIKKMGNKGTPPKGMANVARARAVIQDYISKGGVSAMTGKHVPFFESQLDHRVSLDNGGIDGGDNWDWMEARFNQFKGALTDVKVMDKIQKELAKSPDEAKLKKLQGAYNNFVRSGYKSYFKNNGFDSITKEDVAEAKGKAGEQMLKAAAEIGNVPYYAASKEDRASGRAGGGKFIGIPALKEKLINDLGLMSRDEQTEVNENLTNLVKEISGKGEEISSLQKSIVQRKRDEKKQKGEASVDEAIIEKFIKESIKRYIG